MRPRHALTDAVRKLTASYICPFIINDISMESRYSTAKIFTFGNSQPVRRLPKEFRFAGREVEIFRRGDEVVLREKRGNLAAVFDRLTELSDDMIETIEHMHDVPPEEREGL
jgi:antitoxin VapB